METWVCEICDYHYVPGTPFKDLPEDWVCPDCGARKVSFSVVAN